MKYGIGQPVRRKEDVRLISGRGAYSDDLTIEGQAHACFVRSPHAHARIVSVDISTAASAPGVIGVLTAADLAGIGTMPVAAMIKSRDGALLKMTPKALLAGDKARFCGEAVAMVVANSPAEARDGAELVEVLYEALPAVASVEAARDGALVWDHILGNLSFDWVDGDERACASAFANAARV